MSAAPVKSAAVRMVITDLDGTLLDPDGSVSKKDYETLCRLRDMNLITVIATGRSYFSLRRVIHPRFPIDYLIHSSGAGTMHWPSREPVSTWEILPERVHFLSGYLKELDLDFMIQQPFPDSHFFYYHHSGRDNPDFFRRIRLYRECALPLNGGTVKTGRSSQVIVITENDLSLYHRLKHDLDGFEVVRTTSPLDHTSIWIEIFPAGVSKAHASRDLCRITSCPEEDVLAVGNDYNDSGLLQWAARSAVVANAPEELRACFPVVASNRQSGFSEAVSRYIDI